MLGEPASIANSPVSREMRSLRQLTRPSQGSENGTINGRRKPAGSSTHLDSLTPLRGIAALWVVVFHFMFQYFSGLNIGQHTHLVGKGYLAVDLFFMLSGFVMTHVYHATFRDGVSGDYWSFLRARVARLYPMHLFVLSLFLATALAAEAAQYATTGSVDLVPLEGARSVVALFANLLMLQGLHASTLSWNYPAWSISLEFMAYLAFPFILYAFWRAGVTRKLLLATALVAALGWLAYLTNNDFNQWDGAKSLLRCLPEFMLGMLLYSAFQSGVLQRWLSADAVAVGIMATMIVLLHVGAPDLLVISLMAALMLAAVTNNGWFSALLNITPLIWLGDISYSLYLVHDLVQHVTTTVLDLGFGIADPGQLPVGPSLALMLLMIVACLSAAAVTYRWVEVPGRRCLREALAPRRQGSHSGAHPIRTPRATPGFIPAQIGSRSRSPSKSGQLLFHHRQSPSFPGSGFNPARAAAVARPRRQEPH